MPPSPVPLTPDQIKQQRTKECQSLLVSKSLSWDQFEIFIRAFKKEERLEVWARNNSQESFRLITEYDFCKSSGKLGPKLKEGDLQIPEGIYHINRFNPKSQFHLSLGLNYPNAADLSRADRSAPGSDIFIHGGCVTVGCIPITNHNIELLYILAERARDLGQKEIPVHIFPIQLHQKGLRYLRLIDPGHLDFWKELQPIYQAFEDNKTLPEIRIDENGKYIASLR